MMLVGSGDVSRLVGRPVLVAWLATHVALLAVLVANARPSMQAQAVYWAFWYPVAVGAMQTLILRPLAPASKRPTVVVVAAILLAVNAVWMFLLLVVLTRTVIEAMSPWLALDRETIFRLSPALGGALAGLTQWWVLRPRWHGASFLAPFHAILALVLNAAVTVWFGGWASSGQPATDDARVVFGGISGLALALFTGLALLNLRRRSGLPDDARAGERDRRPASSARVET